MIVTTMKGKRVSIVQNKRGILIDTQDKWWTRDAYKDIPEQGIAGYSCQDGTDSIRFTRSELVRICKGDAAIQQLMTVDEARDFAERLEPRLREIAADWNDQQLREILMEADDTNKSALNLLISRLEAEYKRIEAEAVALRKAEEAAHVEEYLSCERNGTSLAQEGSGGTSVPPRKNTPKKAKGNAFESMYNGELITLTSKQLVIMRAVVAGVDEDGTCTSTGVLQAAVGAGMSAISAGAVLATLGEKKLLTVTKTSTGRVYKLTDAGVWLLENGLGCKPDSQEVG